MALIKIIFKNLLLSLGYSFRKIQKNKNLKYIIEENSRTPRVKPQILEAIFNFHEKIPLFYKDNVRPELQIKGAWLEDLQIRRVNQIEYLISRNKDAYSKLLDNMLRNELVSGLWEVKYYNKNSLGKNAPLQFIHHLEIFQYMTKLDIDILNDGNFGNKWGVKVNNTLLTLGDPYKGLNAFNAASYLNANCKNKALYLDLGSGIGSDAIKVSKLSKVPTRILLCDIPLNLSTAFAYISMNTSEKCILVDTEDKINDLINSDFSENEFLFIPTLFVEELAEKCSKIDLMYNHGSFSEMDYSTISFYLKTLLKNGPVKAIFEINSNKDVENTGGHTEIKSSLFPIPKSFKLIKRNQSFNSYFDHRYLESLYVKIE